MPRGGARKQSGRKLKWGEKNEKIGVPASIANDLVRILEKASEDGREFKRVLKSLDFPMIKKYNSPVFAGANHTSGIDGDSVNFDYEEINLRDELIPDPEKTVIMPVMGDSMVGVGIYPGDWLIVKLINPLYERPQEGDIVIASVNDEIMVKRYRTENGEIVLLSENPDHQPIRFSDEADISFGISGIVQSSIRRNL